MPEKKLVDYIKDGLAKGKSESSIKKSLLAAGWSSAEVSDAFADSKPKNVSELKSEVPKIDFANADLGSDLSFFSRIKSFFVKIWDVCAKPKQFFESVKEEYFKHSLIFYVILTLAFSCIYLIISTLIVDSSLFLSLDFLWSVLYLLLYLVIIFALVIVFFFFIHLFVWLFKGRNGFKQTFKAGFYSATPSFVLGWIPYVNIAAALWTLVLQVYGISKLQELKWWKALLAVFIPALIVVGLLVLYFLLVPLPVTELI